MNVLESLPIGFAARERPAAGHAIFDLIGREWFHLVPRGELSFPFLVQSREIRVLGSQPIAKFPERDRAEIIVKWIGGIGRGKLIAQVVREGMIGGVFSRDGAGLTARPNLPSGVVQACNRG